VFGQDPVLRQSFIKSAAEQKFSVSALKKLLEKKASETKILEGKNGSLEFKNNFIHYRLNSTTKNKPILKLSGNNLIVSGYQYKFIKSRFERISLPKVKGKINLKKWEQGAKMVPLGMKGSKKISDILTDHKLSASQKENVYMLCDDEKPLWLLGLRIDDRVKLTGRESKKEILNLRIV
jgi:tRNA(Ile)-lysidine synthetase-like protein